MRTGVVFLPVILGLAIAIRLRVRMVLERDPVRWAPPCFDCVRYLKRQAGCYRYLFCIGKRDAGRPDMPIWQVHYSFDGHRGPNL